jgi:hypothetical protein
MPKDVREDGRFIKEDGEARKTRNDPHNPSNLMKRNKKQERTKSGECPLADGWTPTHWQKRGGAGKGDKRRPISISEEVYGYKYDLATGRITKKEFDKLMKEYNSK